MAAPASILSVRPCFVIHASAFVAGARWWAPDLVPVARICTEDERVRAIQDCRRERNSVSVIFLGGDEGLITENGELGAERPAAVPPGTGSLGGSPHPASPRGGGQRERGGLFDAGLYAAGVFAGSACEHDASVERGEGDVYPVGASAAVDILGDELVEGEVEVDELSEELHVVFPLVADGTDVGCLPVDVLAVGGTSYGFVEGRAAES